MTLEPGGDLGIGTTNPTQPLDVNGLVRIRGGSPAAGKVLVASDSSGNANWGDPLIASSGSVETTDTVNAGGFNTWLDLSASSGFWDNL